MCEKIDLIEAKITLRKLNALNDLLFSASRHEEDDYYNIYTYASNEMGALIYKLMLYFEII